jgi:hypothetical protein
MDDLPGRDKHVSWGAAGSAARSEATFESGRLAIGFEYAGDVKTPARMAMEEKKILK